MIAVESVLEAILFATDEPISLQDIQASFEQKNIDNFQPNLEELEQALENLKKKYKSGDYAFELENIANGYQFKTKTKYFPYTSLVLKQAERKKLSKAALETLAIIAYKQPITKSELEFIRGVNCDYSIQKLLDNALITPAGRADLPGKPLLYQTTENFLIYFGLSSITDLPKLKEIISDEENIIKEEFKSSQVIESQNS